MNPEQLIQQGAESALQHRTSRRGLFRGAGKGAAGLVLAGTAASLGALLFSSCYPGRSNAITGKPHAVLAARRDSYRDWNPIPYGDAPLSGVEWVKLQGDPASFFAQAGNPDRYTGDTYRTSQICDLAPMSTAVGPLVEVTTAYPGSYAIASKFQHKESNEIIEELHYVDVRPRTPLFERGGVGLLFFDDAPLDLTEAFLTRLKNDGVSTVELVVNLSMPSKTGTELFPGSPSDGNLRSIIEIAHSKHQAVLVKPSLNVENFLVWMGAIAPADWMQWFTNYGMQINGLARICEETGAEALAVGNELQTSQNQLNRWNTLIGSVREIYSGILTYTATNWWFAGEIHEFPSWDVLDVIGANFWIPGSGNALPPSTDPTVEAMVQNFQIVAESWVEPRILGHGKPIWITEFGSGSRDGGNMGPPGQGDGPRDWQEQIDYVEAAMRFFADVIRPDALYYWLQFLVEDAGPLGDANLFDHPVEDAIRLWYA